MRLTRVRFVAAGAESLKTALSTPRLRERRRWVRAWCAVAPDGTLRLQRLPALTAAGVSPPKGKAKVPDEMELSYAATSPIPSLPCGCLLSLALCQSALSRLLHTRLHLMPVTRMFVSRLSRCEVFVPKVAELIAGMHDGKEVHYRALRKCTLRSGRSLTSDSVGTLERGEEVRATKHACERPQRQKLNCPGWVPIDVL